MRFRIYSRLPASHHFTQGIDAVGFAIPTEILPRIYSVIPHTQHLAGIVQKGIIIRSAGAAYYYVFPDRLPCIVDIIAVAARAVGYRMDILHRISHPNTGMRIACACNRVSHDDASGTDPRGA